MGAGFRVILSNIRTFKLRVSDTAPFSAAIADAGTSHHVAQDIVAFVPLVSHAVHHPVVGCTDLFVS